MGDTPVNDYEVMFGKEIFKTVTMLQIGAPGADSLREVAAIMKEATIQQFSTFDDRNEEILQYQNSNGDPGLIDQLSKYLTNEIYREPVDSDDLSINNGASGGVWDLLVRYLRPGDTVFVEDPAYKAMVPHLQKSELNLTGVSMDDQGMRMDLLEEKILQTKLRTPDHRYPFTAVVYLVPVFHNPTTKNMSAERQKQLVELARKYDLLLISDDVYNLLCYSSPESNDPETARPPKRLFAFDDKKDPGYKGNVVSSGTFSKFLGPGLRLGWFEMPRRMLKLHRDQYCFDSGAGKNPYSGALVGVGLKMGLVQKHVKKTRTMYAERMKASHEIIMSTVGKLGVTCHLPSGGAFLWIVLPESVTSSELLNMSKSTVRFLPGNLASPSNSFKNCLRVCITYYETKELLAGVKDLCRYIQQLLDKSHL